MGKKCLVILLLMVLVTGLCGCGLKKADSKKDINTSTEGNTSDSNKATDTTVTQKPEVSKDASNNAASLENKVIYEKDGLKVTSLGLVEDDYGDPALKLSMENTSKKDVTFQVKDVSINGFMYSPLFSVQVTPGNKAEEVMAFYTDDVESYGISKITSIDFNLLVCDSESFDLIDESDVISLSSGEKNSDKAYDTSGKTVYDKDGIKVIAQFVQTDEIMGQEIIFYVENNSDKNITVSNNDDVAINGTMATPLLYCSVVPGKKAVTGMSFSDVKDDIKSAEFSVSITDTDSYDTIGKSDKIALTFE